MLLLLSRRRRNVVWRRRIKQTRRSSWTNVRIQRWSKTRRERNRKSFTKLNSKRSANTSKVWVKMITVLKSEFHRSRLILPCSRSAKFYMFFTHTKVVWKNKLITKMNFTDQIKSFRWPHLARGSYVVHACFSP